MKVWLDDVRTPPDDTWQWAKTSDEAIAFLRYESVSIISLDHDLGLYDDGKKVARFITTMKVRPATIIHSMNPVGAKAMSDILAEKGTGD